MREHIIETEPATQRNEATFAAPATAPPPEYSFAALGNSLRNLLPLTHDRPYPDTSPSSHNRPLSPLLRAFDSEAVKELVSSFKTEKGVGLFGPRAHDDFSPEHNYKINQIILKHKFLSDETLKRTNLKKKYSKIRKTLTLFEVLLIGGEISITVASVALPVLIPLLPIFGGLTASGVGCRFISSYFSKKEKKHETLAILSTSKIRSIEEKFAKALKDGVVTDEEYATIEREVLLYQEYQEAGERYLRGAGVEITDKMKNDLIEKGRNEILASLDHWKRVS